MINCEKLNEMASEVTATVKQLQYSSLRID